jgi:stalled ribosome rescue protein Dom34
METTCVLSKEDPSPYVPEQVEFRYRMRNVKTRKGYRRGYPVAILIGFEADKANLWKVFSHVMKPEKTITLNGDRNDSKAVYNFHETIVNTLRPTLKEGIRGIIVVSPPRSNYSREFIDHIEQHYAWLFQGQNRAVLSTITGSASTPSEVTALARTTAFQKLLSDTTSEETENLLEILEKRLNASTQKALVLYSLEEIEELILVSHRTDKPKPEYLLLTDEYLARSRQKSRIHRLTQIAANRKVKTRIVDAETKAGKRLTQLGGIVCLVQFP